MMNKSLYAITLLSAAILAISCHKESNLNELKFGPITISAEIEGLDNPDTKARTAYKYDVLWGSGDKIIVKGQTGSDTFTLTGGAETTMGTFKQDNEVALSGEVESFYPMSIVSGESLLWPSEQGSDQVPPMYCKKSITGKTENFSFRSLGAMLQLVLSTTDSDITLSSIRISDASKPLSGAFTVQDGKAVMAGSGKSAIVLNTGGVKIGNAAKYFNIAVPAGKYDNLKLTFLSNDGKGVAMYSTTMPEIQHNTVAKISLCAKNFSPVPTGFALDLTELGLPVGGHHKLMPQFTPADTYNKKVLWTSSNPAVATVGADGMVKAVTTGSTTITAQLEDEDFSAYSVVTVTAPAAAPADALVGLFSVSDNKVVRFAKSNLRNNKVNRGFFDNQYTMAQGEDIRETFYLNELQDWLQSTDGAGWQVLSNEEWTYLFGDNNFRKGLFAGGVTVVDQANCVVLYPDGYNGVKPTDENKTTIYATPEAWGMAQNEGAVCLTPVKCENGSDYWSSSPDSLFRLLLYSGALDLKIWYYSGNPAYAVRPVTEVK